LHNNGGRRKIKQRSGFYNSSWQILQKMNKYFNYRLILALISIIFLCPAALLRADIALPSINPNDYIQTTYPPVTFDKTQITGTEIFYATIAGKGLCTKDLPKAAAAGRFTYEYIASNKTTGEQEILNPFYTVTIQPFPQKAGDVFQTSNQVPLQFPDGSKAGKYTITEQMIKAEMEDTMLSRQIVTEPASPTAPTAPAQPTTITSQTIAPSKSREIGTVSYTPGESVSGGTSIPTPTTPSSAITPIITQMANTPPVGLATPATPELSNMPQKIQSVTSCSGTCVPTGQSCPYGTSGQGVSDCKPAQTNCYRCGWFWLQTCCDTIPTFCCVHIQPAISVSISPASVISGAPSVGTITLNTALNNDQAVQLSANPVGSVIMPAAVTVKAGTTSANFNIQTNVVILPVNVTIKAAANNSQATSVITINPIALSALNISPATVPSGASSAGTVTLNGPALSGGQIVLLSASPSGSVVLPASVKVQAGAISGNFSIAANTVPSPVTVTVTAVLLNLSSNNNLPKTATMAISPAPGPCSYTCRPAARSGSSWVMNCNSSETAQPWLSCQKTTQCYSCGFWGLSKCCDQVDSVCCKPK